MSAFIVVVGLEIEDDALAAFLPLMRQNAAASLRDEPGCRQFDVCQDASAATTILLYEVYDNEAAFAAHLASTHYLAFDTATKAMIRSKSVRRFLRED
jgi:autoinducer 2-degrading protein